MAHFFAPDSRVTPVGRRSRRHDHRIGGGRYSDAGVKEHGSAVIHRRTVRVFAVKTRPRVINDSARLMVSIAGTERLHITQRLEITHDERVSIFLTMY